MTLPANDLFEGFLADTTVIARKPDGLGIQIFDPSTSAAPCERELWISYPASDLKLESVLRAIGRELQTNGGVGDVETNIAVLALIVETYTGGLSRVEHANKVLGDTQNANLYQSIVFPHSTAADYIADFETIRFGAFVPDQYVSLASQGMASYPVDLAAFAGRFCIERQNSRVKIIDFAQEDYVRVLLENWTESTARVLVDVYFQAVNLHFFSEIPEMARDELRVLEAGSLMCLDEGLFKQMAFQTNIGLFSWSEDGSRAWALLGQQKILHMNTPPCDLVAECREWLDSEFGPTKFSESRPFDQACKTYCAFMQKAQAYRLSKKDDDAFLHFVIALDLLLGDEGRLSDSVCKRAAALTFSQLDNSLAGHASSIRRLYGKRSKYVHEGTSINEDDLANAEKICLEVLWVLLAALQIEELNQVEDWLLKIDYLFAGITADRSLAEEDFTAIGLPAEGRKRVPPNHLVPNAVSERLFLNPWGSD